MWMAALEVMLDPRSFGYPKILLYAAGALVFAHAASRPTRPRIAGLALMTVVAFLFRHDHGVFIGIGAVAALATASINAGWPTAARRVAAFGGWVALFAAPWAMFVQLNGGLVSYFSSALAFSRGEAREAGFRALPHLSPALGAQDNALVLLFYVFNLLPVICLGMLVVRRWRWHLPEAWPGETATVAAIALMAMPMSVTLLRGGFQLDARIPDAVVPAALLGAWLLGRLLQRNGGRQIWRLTVAIAAMAVVTAVVVRAADVRSQLDRMNVLAGGRAVAVRAQDLWVRLHQPLAGPDYQPSRYAAAMVPFIEYVQRCTTHRDRLLMTALFPEVYVMADRGFAGGHQAFMRSFYTSDADQQLMMARLERQSVPFVIVVNEWAPELLAEMPRLSRFIDMNYRPLVAIPVPETKGVEIYVDRRRVAGRSDSATGWPCFAA
jgi:hypothetical protein